MEEIICESIGTLNIYEAFTKRKKRRALQAVVEVHFIMIRYTSCVPMDCRALPLMCVTSAAQRRPLTPCFSSPVTTVLPDLQCDHLSGACGPVQRQSQVLQETELMRPPGRKGTPSLKIRQAVCISYFFIAENKNA